MSKCSRIEYQLHPLRDTLYNELIKSDSIAFIIKEKGIEKKYTLLTKEQQTHNNALAERYNQKGFFPLVVMLDMDGNVLGETGYIKRTPKEFIKLITSY